MTTLEPLRSPPQLTSNGSNGLIPHENGIVEPTTIQPFDTSVFQSYLTSLLPPVLGASPDELDSIFDDEFEERVSRFAAEGGGVIYVVKVKDELEGESHCIYKRMNGTMTFFSGHRRCTANLFLPAHFPSQLRTIPCHLPSSHQAHIHT